MTKSTIKFTLLALIVALALSGCNLIRTNPEYIAQQEAERERLAQEAYELDMATVLARYAGGEVTKGEVIDEYEAQKTAMENYYAQMNYMYYYYFGSSDQQYTMTAEDYETLKQQAITTTTQRKIVNLKADELGVGTLTEQDLADIQASAEEQYQNTLTYYMNNYGVTEATAKTYLENDGLSVEEYYKQAKYAEIDERVSAIVNADTSVNDDEILAKYEALVAEQTEEFTSSPAELEQHVMMGDTAYYVPEGYRYVKHVFLKPEDDQLMPAKNALVKDIDALEHEIEELDAQIAELLAATPSEATLSEAEIDGAQALKAEKQQEIAQKQAELDAKIAEVWAAIDDKLTEVTAKIEAGEDFDQLIAEYSQDTGSFTEPVKSNGYFVYEHSSTWDGAFLEAAFSVDEVGEVAQAKLGSLGVYIVKYEAAAPAGALAFEAVADDAKAQALEAKMDEKYGEAKDGWYEDAAIEYFFDAWQL